MQVSAQCDTVLIGLCSVLRPCQHSIGYMGDGLTLLGCGRETECQTYLISATVHVWKTLAYTGSQKNVITKWCMISLTNHNVFRLNIFANVFIVKKALKIMLKPGKNKQESLADAKVSARYQCMYEGP